MKRYFQKYPDDRFGLTTLQNPLCEVRTHAELIQAAQQEREYHPGAAQIAATQPLAAPGAPDSTPAVQFASCRNTETYPGTGLSAGAGEPILISSSPNIKKRCKPLKTFNSDPC
jgi:hypothetical protein